MDEITFDGKTYVSSKRAAQITGYAKDYIGQLCREGRVEARLVGRNWYVLETSLREHRFGPDPAEKIQKTENTSWESAQYVPETVSAITTIDQSSRIPVLDHKATVQEMQDAWQDWFTKKNDELSSVLEEEFIESSEIAETPEEVEAEIAEEDPAEVVHVVKVTPQAPVEAVREPEYTAPKQFDIQDKEEIVSVQRSPQIQLAVSSAVSHKELRQLRHAPPTPVYKPVYAPSRQEGRILHERRVRRKKKPSVALQALLLSIAGIAIVVALIGSGQADAFLSQNRIQYAPINYLGGESIINK